MKTVIKEKMDFPESVLSKVFHANDSSTQGDNDNDDALIDRFMLMKSSQTDEKQSEEAKEAAALARVQLQEEYNDLWQQKQASKRRIYRRVLLLGYCLTYIGMLGFFMSNFLSVPPFLNVIFAVLLSVGVATFTTVPVDEFTIEAVFAHYKLTRQLAVIPLFLVNTWLAFYSGQWYVAYLHLLVSGTLVLHFGFKRLVEHYYRNLFAKLMHYQSTFSSLSGCVSLTFLVTYINFFAGSVSERTQHRKEHTSSAAEAYSDIAVWGLGIVGWLYFYWHHKKERALIKWKEDDQEKCIHETHIAQTRLLYLNLFVFITIFYYQGAIKNASSVVNRGGAANMVALFLVIFILPVPFLTILVIGRDRYFQTTVRMMEFGFENNLDDGAWMASLASQSDVLQSLHINDTDLVIFWVYRNRSALHGSTEEDHQQQEKGVDRQFWMMGTAYASEDPADISTTTGSFKEGHILVSISFHHDNDLTWRAKFEGKEMLFTPELSSTVLDPAEVPQEEFNEWVKSNFYDPNKGTCMHADMIVSNPFVRIHVEVSTKKSKEELREFARANLFRFKVTGSLANELFITSPREMNEYDKEAVFGLGEKVDTDFVEEQLDKGKDLRIDYFVSHSWAEERHHLLHKAESMKMFADDFRDRNGFYPHVWLDKVCIDQKNPGLGISVLPLNVVYCKKLLVVLTDSYFTRLWCLWEIFTLFIFCKKEVAVDKIDILALDGSYEDWAAAQKQPGVKNNYYRQQIRGLEKLLLLLENFNVDEAHCFSPNEEFKIRQILHCIGAKRVEELSGAIRTVVQYKLQILKRWAFTSGLINSATKSVVSIQGSIRNYGKREKSNSSKSGDSGRSSSSGGSINSSASGRYRYQMSTSASSSSSESFKNGHRGRAAAAQIHPIDETMNIDGACGSGTDVTRLPNSFSKLEVSEV